jgi:hypothetical protein
MDEFDRIKEIKKLVYECEKNSKDVVKIRVDGNKEKIKIN